MDKLQLVGYMLVVTLIAFIIERYSRLHKAKTHKFGWLHYTLFISYPLALSVLVIYSLGKAYAIIFLIAALFGTITEWLVGYYYNQIVGQKLWIYKRFAINGYTSWLIIPVWGLAGLLFAFLGSMIIAI